MQLTRSNLFCFQRQNTTTAVANSFKSTVKSGGTRTLSGRDKKYDKRFVAKVATPKSSVSDVEDDGTLKRIREMMICQRLVCFTLGLINIICRPTQKAHFQPLLSLCTPYTRKIT